MHSSTNTDFPKIERLYNSLKIYITQKCKSIVLLADITMHTKQRKEQYVVVSSIRSELPLCPQKGYFLFILFKLFPKLSNIWWGKKTKHFTQVSIVMSGPEKNYKLNTYVLSVYFCAARSRSSRAPSSSSSSSLSVKSSGWLPRCGGGPWHPLVLLWPLSSPLHPPFACLPPPSASPPPVAQTLQSWRAVSL